MRKLGAVVGNELLHTGKIVSASFLLVWLSLCILASSAMTAPIELSHDQGKQAGFLALAGNFRHVVSFSPPTIPWQITKIRIFGFRFGERMENISLILEIWGTNRSVLITPVPYSIFKTTPTWVEVDTADMVVTADFTVTIFSRSTSDRGIQIGFDTSVENQHSDVAQGMRLITDWSKIELAAGATGAINRDRTNWMVRVEGMSETVVTRTRATTSTPIDASIFSSLNSQMSQIAGGAVTGGSIVLGWLLKTRKRRLISDYLKKIDIAYINRSASSEESKRQLIDMRSEILDLLHKGRIDEAQFSLLDAKLMRCLENIG